MPISAGILAAMLYFKQGGFGGGHGSLDGAIALLCLPSILLVAKVSSIGMLPPILPDFVVIVVIPMVLNVAFWMTPGTLLLLIANRIEKSR